jgi:hypothetical protein
MKTVTKPYLSEKDIFPEALNITKVFGAVTGTKTTQDVHQARVLVKKLRARLKLVSVFLPEKEFIAHIDSEMRKFNQHLSHLRDFEVVSVTLQEFAQKHRDKNLKKIINELQGYFRVKIQQEKTQTDSLQQQAEQIITELNQLNNIELPNKDVHDYLMREFSNCCKSGEKAIKGQKCDKLHKWRKSIKSLLYQIQVVKTTDKKLFKHSALLDKSGKHLGKVHDFCFIMELIDDIQQEMQLENDAKPLLELLAKEKHRQILKVKKMRRKMCNKVKTRRKTHTS